MVDAEVLAADGGFGAAGLVVEVFEALVEVIGVLLVWSGVVHGYPYPPPRGLWKTWIFGAKGKARRVPGLFFHP